MNLHAEVKYAALHRMVRGWLWLLATLVFMMVLLGGVTRLTDSGLSITEWQPLLGVVPPLNEADWHTAFEKYKAIPEYNIVNRGMSLSDFKYIYWWEWTHRFLGRLIGLVLLVPLLGLWAAGRLERRTLYSLLVLLALGGLQGALGWYMVQSGLVERTDVSQYRLAAHLVLAAIIFASLLWVVLGIGVPRRRLRNGYAWTAFAIIAMIVLQIGLGGLVAGLDAGLSHNTFPLMDGRLVPNGLLVMSPWWKNFFENALTVQFVHRLAAYALAIAALLHAISLSRSGQNGAREISGWALVFAFVGQMALGVWTLLAGVPLHLGLLHQAGAMLVLAVAVIHLHLVTRRI